MADKVMRLAKPVSEAAIDDIAKRRSMRHIHDYFQRADVAESGPPDFWVSTLELSHPNDRCQTWGCDGMRRVARVTVSGIAFVIQLCDGRCASISTESAWRV